MATEAKPTTKPTSKPKRQSKPNPDAQRASRQANLTTEIDFTDGADESAFAHRAGPGLYQRKLAALLAGVEDEAGEVGTYYRIGLFNSESGASTTRTAILAAPEKMEALVDGGLKNFDLKTRPIRTNGKITGSELRAAVLPGD